jgi:hypothetical protein
METLIAILIQWVGAIPDLVNSFFASLADVISLLVAGGTASLAFAGGISRTNIPSEILAAARRWHGSIDEQFGNIDNLVLIIQAHSAWSTPPQFSQIVTNRTLLAALIFKCRSPQGSSYDRARRNTLLKTTVDLCLMYVKIWAYGMYNNNPTTFTIDDLHSLGFLLPGETSGGHRRTEATRAVAEVKITILSADVILAVIDQASSENAAPVAHGWPPGVKFALIVILSPEDGVEVYRLQTTRLYNEIRMPAGSHGKPFVAKASFLKHIDDEPVFGPQPTFTMPYSTEDLTHSPDRQHQEEYESLLRAARQEAEQQAAAAAAAAAQTPKK